MPKTRSRLKFAGDVGEDDLTKGEIYIVTHSTDDAFDYMDDVDDECGEVFCPKETPTRWFIRKPVEPVSDTDRLPDLNNFTLTCAHPHREVCEQLHDIYQAKNADYGNSFSEQYKEHGMVSSVIRLDDKMRRLKQLTKNDALVNESIEDTLLDLANYAIMTVMELRSGSNVDETSRKTNGAPKG